jgi:thiol-disulfide isomerase/thioredoxin
MKKAGLLFLTMIFALSLFAQKYEIKVKINGISDTVIYLGHHFGEKKYVVDTARIDSKGYATFTGDKELNRGIYLIVMPSKGMTYFEFLIGEAKKFSIETDTANFVDNMKIKGCKENIVFNQYQKRMTEIQNQRGDLMRQYEAAKENADEQKKISEQLTELNKLRVSYMDELVKQNPNTFFSKVLLSMKEVEIPESPKDSAGNEIDPHFGYKFYKAHYWDYIDWSESGLLRTPIFEGKLNYYFDKMIVPSPDSMMPEARKMIRLSYEAGDTLMFQFTASHLLHYFESSKIMGYDAVFVDIAEEWYLSGKAHWADSAFMVKLLERVNKITPTKLGNIATDLKRMQTIDDKYISLHQVDADYTILVFYEPHCGHCKKEVPILMQQYRDSLKTMNVKIFALYTQYDKEEWKTFLDEKNLYEDGWYNVWDGPYPHTGFRDFYDIYSTPVVYVLDRDKKIIGKRIGIESIKSLIEFEKERKARDAEKK